MNFKLSRIALLLGLAMFLTAVGGIVATYFVAKDEFRDVLDRDLKTQSKLLIELLEDGYLAVDESDFNDLLEDVFEFDDEETIWVNVFDIDRSVHYSNLDNALPLLGLENTEVDLQFDDHAWLGYQRVADSFAVQLLRRDDYLDKVREEILEDIATPILITSFVYLLLLAILIALALLPLTRLSRQLQGRNANSLEPLIFAAPVQEVALFRDTLNGLLRDVAVVLKRERQFADDVAHELRTPLTTLKLELANLRPDYPAVKSEVDRLSALVGQLLTLARVEQGHWQQNFESVRLDRICEQQLANLAPILDDAGIEYELELQRVSLSGDQVLLEVLVQNLVRNVVQHCGAGTMLRITLDRTSDSSMLQFTDNGPGIDAAHIASLNAGSARLDSRGDGLGLGLSICRKIADSHGAAIQFLPNANGNRGLTVRIEFPA